MMVQPHLILTLMLSSEILVLGTGSELVRPDPNVLKFLLVRGIHTEIGSTVRIVAACPLS